jgi:Ca2+-binding EF-hand superfamily protein
VAPATCLLLAAAIVGQGPAKTPAAGPTRAAVAALPGTASRSAEPPASDRRDVIILLEGGPLHLRLNVAMGGVSLAEARRAYITRLITSLDTDKDGKLTRTEAQRSPLLRTKNRPGAAAFIESLGGGKAALTRRNVEQTIDKIGGEAVVYREDLSSSKSDLEVFKLLDKNGSGVLEMEELRGASDLIAAKDEDGDECVSFEEFFPPPPAPDPMAVAAGLAEPAPVPLINVVPTLVFEASDFRLPKKLYGKYSKDRDLMLSPAELDWTPERLDAFDRDKNGKLDVAEMATLGTGTPDIELSVDMKSSDGQGGQIHVHGTHGKRLDDSGRLDFAKVGFEGAVVTFSHRNLDPIALAIETAMRQFNQIDQDANGYLDKDETALLIRFERGLFDIIDVDSDGKIFADEMKQYIEARAEPVAATCRVTVYDTGSGYFMALDANADGRVSLREMRRTEASLSQLERDGKPGIAEKEPTRHFHVEFVRGSYQLFGPSEQLLAQTPAFQKRTPTGPIWFQRMDRNNDGDLTWNEFLGPREVFHDLDDDTDGLLDPQEAAKAK